MVIILYILLGFLSLIHCSYSDQTSLQNFNPEISHLLRLEKLNLISPASLPPPYKHLLTQTLMTPELERYYQGSALIQVIYSQKNHKSYSRAILMLIDTNKKRINPAIAHQKMKAKVAEFAFITMNFAELPKRLIKKVLHTSLPFGKLLLHYDIKTVSTGRQYFWVICNEKLAFFTQCQLNNKLYGRIHTLIRADNNKWVARVLEILS